MYPHDHSFFHYELMAQLIFGCLSVAAAAMMVFSVTGCCGLDKCLEWCCCEQMIATLTESGGAMVGQFEGSRCCIALWGCCEHGMIVWLRSPDGAPQPCGVSCTHECLLEMGVENAHSHSGHRKRTPHFAPRSASTSIVQPRMTLAIIHCQ
jgi:hypothetical protein